MTSKNLFNIFKKKFSLRKHNLTMECKYTYLINYFAIVKKENHLQIN